MAIGVVNICRVVELLLNLSKGSKKRIGLVFDQRKSEKGVKKFSVNIR